MRRSVTVVLMVACACFAAVTACVSDSPGTTDGGSQDGSSDVQSDANGSDGSDSAIDADASTPACDLAKPFGAPVIVPGLPTVSVSNPTFSADERTVYFHQHLDGGRDLYVATRATPSSAFGAATALAVNSGKHPAEEDSDPTLSEDGLTLVWHHQGPSSSMHDLFISKRVTTAAQFTMTAPLAGPVNTPDIEYEPYLRPNGNALYFTRSVAIYHIYSSALVAGQFAAPVMLAELATNDGERHVVVSGDELQIFWSSQRQDIAPKGGYDVYTATRATPNGPFSNVKNLSEVNTALNDHPAWISLDGCRLYLANGTVATRPN